ncbi:chain length determinant protein [Thioalkalivibrio sulfidiphilus HL-EbGr7]|uniref:Chain length determinant protein n=1 Tax=Thioalkalivibrio sulfidiphilus (strain HL-EbGR7) TaxID=396588 RepID=B8GQX0_THISH|nr:chain-length determining protein [Thioalkalivibrio sulfidiphilus]ACL72390.1 chain length determinant protein [Thioalkalivibrio sulfidiphilus HL-EbGr7]
MKTLLKKHPYWLVALVAILLSSVYWAFLATHRYVSQANVVLQSAQIATPNVGIAAILSGAGSNELLILRDHLQSVDMLRRLDEALDLRNHYSQRNIDRLSRLGGSDVPMEDFHRYYLRRVSVDLDEYAQVLRVKAGAYDPEIARAIVVLLLQEGELHMNRMAQRLAAEQVKFIEAQVDELSVRLARARDALLAYQNEMGLVSPTATVESISAVIANLEGELARLNARRTALGASQSERSPEMVSLRNEIEAVRNQISIERARLAAQSGDTLNRLSAEYETLNLQVEFARDMYANALAALENTRVEAARSLKQISVLQEPTHPEYPTEPRRLYNITVFTILALLAGLIAHLLAAIVRDHRD